MNSNVNYSQKLLEILIRYVKSNKSLATMLATVSLVGTLAGPITAVAADLPRTEIESMQDKDIKAATASEITVIVDGKKVNFDQQPKIINSRTMVPLRGIFEALGATIDYDGETRKVTAVFPNGTIFEHFIGSKLAIKNGEVIATDQESVIEGGRTMVTVDLIKKGADKDAAWDGKTRTVTISDPVEKKYMNFTMDQQELERCTNITQGQGYSVGISHNIPNRKHIIYSDDEYCYYLYYYADTFEITLKDGRKKLLKDALLDGDTSIEIAKANGVPFVEKFLGHKYYGNGFVIVENGKIHWDNNVMFYEDNNLIVYSDRALEDYDIYFMPPGFDPEEKLKESIRTEYEKYDTTDILVGSCERVNLKDAVANGRIKGEQIIQAEVPTTYGTKTPVKRVS